MRVFPGVGEAAGKSYELDVREAGGGVLLVSNFTVAAETAKGRRPSLSAAAGPEVARGKFEQFVGLVRGIMGEGRVATGEFGAAMRVEIVNDGPCTFLVDSRGRPGR
jgi:D-tyrosyl-tRNA(Tyr) deacylase